MNGTKRPPQLYATYNQTNPSLPSRKSRPSLTHYGPARTKRRFVGVICLSVADARERAVIARLSMRADRRSENEPAPSSRHPGGRPQRRQAAEGGTYEQLKKLIRVT
jgi:hypothetical protein